MIDFREITLADREIYEKYLFASGIHTCERSFGNIYLWGSHQMAIVNNHLVMQSQYGKYKSYPYPLGEGNKRDTIDKIIDHARENNNPIRISSMNEVDAAELEEMYPGMFEITSSPDTSDYIYDINDLADLKGRKYHRKRNHIHRFKDAYPNYLIESISEENIGAIKKMVEKWYELKKEANPEENYDMEMSACFKGLDNYSDAGLDGLVLFDNAEDRNILAFTMGSKLTPNIFDAQFEKAWGDVVGAYAVINNEFAIYIRDKFPEITYIDREEDMGIEGLRKAKESYFPAMMNKRLVGVLKQ